MPSVIFILAVFFSCNQREEHNSSSISQENQSTSNETTNDAISPKSHSGIETPLHYKFTNYDQEQGLPFGTIRGIYRDTTGYLWISSEGGASRFDGYTFKTFRHNPDDSTSLPKDFGWNCDFLNFGDVYYGTPNGLCKFNSSTLSFSSNRVYPDSLKIIFAREAKEVKDHYWILRKLDILRITKTGRERLALPYPVNLQWGMLASPDRSVMLYRSVVKDSILFLDFHSKTISNINKYDRQGQIDSSSIMEVICAGNNFYLFTKKSLFHFDSARKSFLWQLDLKRTQGFDYEADRYLVFNDTLAVMSSLSGHLNIFNLRTGEERLVYVNKKIPETELNDRLIFMGKTDHHGGIWMGTNQMGLIHYNLFTGTLEQYIHEPGNANSLPSNFVNNVFPDENGVVWASCFGHGLVKMEPERALFETVVPTTNSNKSFKEGGWKENIRSFVETEDGYWIATLKGMYGYSNQTKQYSYLQHLLSSEFRDYTDDENSEYLQIGSLAKDGAGNYWIGNWYGELVVYNSKLKQSFILIRSKPLVGQNHDWIRHLYCDSKNRMWISTKFTGVSMIDCNFLNFDSINAIQFNINSFNASDSASISSDCVFVVNEDPLGRIWAGTDNGLCRYDETTKKWKRYYNKRGDEKSIHNNDIRSLCVDRLGILWIGTNGGGLNRYNSEQDNFAHFTTENGLPDEQIYSLVCDNNGMLWMGTNHGLCRFNPLNFSCKNFTEKDGIQNYEYNTGAALKLTDGSLLFGGVAGYNIIDPDKIENKEAKPPRVVISSFKVFDKETPIGNHSITLHHQENNLSIEFAALNYFHNQENRYAYMLEGVDPDWVFSDTRRYVSYSQLKPGHYTFKAKASNWDGIWNETGTQFKFIISPPWWLTWWAYSSYLVITAAVVFIMLSFFKRRVLLHQQLKTEQEEAIRLKELDTFKSQLFTNLTHEFRTPLTVILGMAKQLAVGNWQLAVGSTEKKRVSHGLELIENNGKNLLQLINQLLDLSKLENKSFKLQQVRSDIIPYLRYLTESFLSLAEDFDLSLRFKTEKETLVMDFDPEQMKQIMTNLITNAIKFTPAGGEVSVMVSTSANRLQIDVKDTGIGIGEKDLPHILDRFYQADSSSTRVAQGTGIGLAHTQELLKVMDGSLIVESEVGKGTIVTIRLPILHNEVVTAVNDITTSKPNVSLVRPPREQVADDQHELQQPSNDGTLPQLLIIEDNPDVVEYLKSCLESAYEVAVAYDGKTGIEKAMEQIPDFIISDVMMPVMDGFQVCDRLKNDEHTSHIPIILLTAKADAASRLTGLRRGADAYMAKPFSPEELDLQIFTLLENRKRMANYFSRALRSDSKPATNGNPIPEEIQIEDAFIKKVKAIIELHYSDEQFALPQLCDEIGMSRSQLFRKMKAIADVSPSDLIRTYRLQKAKSLLEQGDVTVAEVTYQVGFKDPSYFSKMFQEEFGIQPSSI